MNLPHLKELDSLKAYSQIGPEDFTDKPWSDRIFMSANNQKKALKDLTINMRFTLYQELDEKLWDENTPPWIVLRYILDQYRLQSDSDEYTYQVMEGEYVIRSRHSYKDINSYPIYCLTLDILDDLKKKSRLCTKIFTTCISALHNEKHLGDTVGYWIDGYWDSLDMEIDDSVNKRNEEEDTKRTEELAKELDNSKRKFALLKEIFARNSTRKDIEKLLVNKYNTALEQYFFDFAEKVIKILNEPHDIPFFDEMSFDDQFDRETCEDNGEPVKIEQYITILPCTDYAKYIEGDLRVLQANMDR